MVRIIKGFLCLMNVSSVGRAPDFGTRESEFESALLSFYSSLVNFVFLSLVSNFKFAFGISLGFLIVFYFILIFVTFFSIFTKHSCS